MKRVDSPVRTQPQLMMPSSFSVFRAGISFVMMCIFYTSAVDSPELSPQTFFSTLQPGKATLVYFCQAGKYFLYFNMIFVMFLLVFNHYAQGELIVRINKMCFKAATMICLPGFES